MEFEEEPRVIGVKNVRPWRYFRVEPHDEGRASLAQRIHHLSADLQIVCVRQQADVLVLPVWHTVVPAAQVDAHADGARWPVFAVRADGAQRLITLRMLVDVPVGQE